MSSTAAAKTRPEPKPDPRKALLEAERARLKAAREPRVRPPAGTTWRPSPTQGENDITSAIGSPVMSKVHDLSPVDPAAFDPTPGPALPAMPVNTTPPQVQAVDGDEVGDLLVVTQGVWTGPDLVYARQWRRNGAAIWGANGPTYVLSYLDVGAMIGAAMTATNAGGSTSAVSNAVGPVVP